MNNDNLPAVYYDAKGKEIAVEGQWEKVIDPESANYRQWDNPGTSVVGTLLTREPTKVKSTLTFAYRLSTGPDPKIDFVEFHGTMGLDRLLAEVEPGTVIRVTYEGETETADKNTFKNFDVQAIVKQPA